MNTIRWLAVLVFAVLFAAGAHGADGGASEPARSGGVEVYTFAELLAKAERIVVADVGPTKDGAISLVVRETIKAPENAAKFVDPERLKRAAALLADDKLVLPPLPELKAPGNFKILLQNVAAPREGVQAIFFLWDRAEGGSRPEPAYKLSHPQCMYDVELLPQVKAGVSHPRTIADGRFLREWDRQMAERKTQHDAAGTMLKMKGGEVVMGLRLRAARPTLSLRGNNSFGVTGVVENTRARDQSIYDGPAGGYGIVIRPKGNAGADSAAVVLRQSTKVLGADPSVLNLTDLTDFSTVLHEGSISKELFFDAHEFPILTTLQGDYTVSVFFSSAQDGKGLDLDSPVWTGMMISEPVALRFESPTSQK